MKKNNKTSSIITSIQEIATTARDRGIVHLFTEDEYFDGRIITINKQRKINFGSCSYLGLETDYRLKEAGMDALHRYGSQFACSRAFVSCTLYEEFEQLIGEIFKAPLLLATTTSQGHQAVIPIVVDDNDAVILDHQAHYSMQEVAQKLQLRGIKVTILRHNRLDELQSKYDELSIKHEKVWYFIDGVYSMYGDLAPIEKIKDMLNLNKKMWVYVDDAHGIGWAGENGSGYVLSKMKLHPRMIFTTSLGKGFGNAGGVFVFPDKELCWKVKSWGGPLAHSGPQPPAVIGACIASAKIHLSPEIYSRQSDLQIRINFCNSLLKQKNIPLVANSHSPVFFIGLGLTKVAYNLVNRIIAEGFYVNLGIFPAVPESCSGLRFTITLHQSLEDIEAFVETLAFHLPLALKEENRTLNDIYKAFRGFDNINPKIKTEVASEQNGLKIQTSPFSKLRVQHETTIDQVGEKYWNKLFEKEPTLNHNFLKSLESVFSNNERSEDNWKFDYFIVKDEENNTVAATFLTTVLNKDDMLSDEFVSKKIEAERLDNPYYLTSKSIIMGTLITEGNHLFLDKLNQYWKEALMLILDAVWAIQEKDDIPTVYLRDFDSDDKELSSFFMDRNFIKVTLPDTHILDLTSITSPDEFVKKLTHKNRLHLKNDVFKYENEYQIRVVPKGEVSNLTLWYELYNNVKNKNHEINTFKLPIKFFENIANSNEWEILELHNYKQTPKLAALVCVQVSKYNYNPILIGIDYKFLSSKIYKQVLYRITSRAIELKALKVNLGFTTSLEKRKLGAKAISQVAYFHSKDNYNMSLINLMPNI